MDGVSGLIIVALLVGLPAWALWERRRARLRSPFRTTARTPVARASAGRMAVLVGAVRCTEAPIRAPLTGRACVLYQVVVKEDDGGDAFTSIHRECKHQPAFRLEDPTGNALVRLRRHGVGPLVQPSFGEHVTLSSAWHEPPGARLAQFIQDRGLKERSSFLRPTRRLYEEGIVAEGDIVAVVGVTRLELDRTGVAGNQPYRDAAHMVAIEAPAELPLRVSTEEWAVGAGSRSRGSGG